MSAVVVPERLREVDEAWAQALAASIEEHGLEQPIVVRPHLDPGHFILVAGAHRHRAAELLSWAVIPAIVREIDEDQARLVEIDENLMRRELNALDRAVFLLERKEVHERLHPETRHGGDRRRIKSQTLRLDPARFTTDVADKVGLSERTVQAAIQLATKLDREAVACIRGTWIANKQAELVKLAAEPPAKQRTLALMIRDNSAPSLDVARIRAGFSDAAPPEAIDPQGGILARLMELWVKATPATRDRFRAEIALADEAAATMPRKGRGK